MKLRATTAAMVLAITGTANAAPTYNIIDLGAGIAQDINNFGQVVGTLAGQGAFLWTPAAANGSTGGATILGSGSAWAINSMGQFVGSQGNSGFLWTPGVANGTTGTSTTLTFTGATTTNLFGINDAGRIVGTRETSTLVHGIEWTPTTTNGASGTFRDLGDLPGSGSGSNISGATDINNVNQIVGVSVTTNLATNPNYNAVLWQPGTTCGTSGTCTNIGDLNGGSADTMNNATLHAINDGGVAVGFGSPSNTGVGGSPINHAMRWTPSSPNGATGTLADLGTLAGDVSSNATDINNNGVIVGYSGEFVTDNPATSRAMYYENGVMIELQSLVASNDPLLTQFLLAQAWGINDLGQIVGRGYVNGVEHAFLLVEAQPIPVPAAVWLLGSALLGVAGAARRQRRRQT